MSSDQMCHTLSPALSPFQRATKDFVYLDVFVTSVLQLMYKANYQPLLKHIHED